MTSILELLNGKRFNPISRPLPSIERYALNIVDELLIGINALIRQRQHLLQLIIVLENG